MLQVGKALLCLTLLDTPSEFKGPCDEVLASLPSSEVEKRRVALQEIPQSGHSFNVRLDASRLYTEQLGIGDEARTARIGQYDFDVSYIYRLGLRDSYMRDVGMSVNASGTNGAAEFPEAVVRRGQRRVFLGLELPAPRKLGNSLWIGGSYDQTRTRFPHDGSARWKASAYTGLLRLNLTRKPHAEQAMTYRSGSCEVNNAPNARHDFRRCGGDRGRNFFYGYHRYEEYDDSTAGELRTGLPLTDRRTGFVVTTSWARSYIESEHIDGLFNQIAEEDYTRWSLWVERLEQTARDPTTAEISGLRSAVSWRCPWIRAEDPLVSVEARAQFESYNFEPDEFERSTVEGTFRVHLRHLPGFGSRNLTKFDAYARAGVVNWASDGEHPFVETSVGFVVVFRVGVKDSIPEGGGSDVDKLPGAGSAPPVVPPNLLN